MASQRRTGAILGYINVAVKNIVYLLYTPMLLAFMGQSDYGVYETCYSFVFSLQLLSFGFAGAYVRFFMIRDTAGDEAGIRQLNGMYLILYLGICSAAIALGFGFSGFSGAIFSGSFTTAELSLASALMMVMTFNVATTLFTTVFDSYIIAHERFTFHQSRQLVASIAAPGLTLVLLNLGMGAIGAALAQLIVNLLLLMLNIRYAVAMLGWRCNPRGFDGALFKSLIAFSGWLFVNELFNLLTLNLPSVVLGAVSGSVVISVFAITVKLRGAFYAISTTMSNLFIPAVNRVVAETDDNNELTLILSRVGRYQAILYCWVLGGFVITGRWFISAWAGPEFDEAYYMTIATLVPATVPLIQNVGIEIQKAKNKHKARSLAYLICSIVDLGITLVLADSFGAWAAVYGYIFYIVVAAWFFMNWYYHYRIGLDMVFYWKRVAPILLSCAVVTAAGFFGATIVPVSGLMVFLIWGVVYTVVYGVAIWFFALDDQEKERVKAFPTKIMRR